MALVSVWKYPQYFQVILHRYSNLPNLSSTNHELCRPHLAIRNFFTINVKRRRRVKTKTTVLGLPGAPSSSASSQFAFHRHHIIPLSAVSYQSATFDSNPIIFLRHHRNPRTYSNCHTCDVQISKSTIPTPTTSTTDHSVTKNAFSQFSAKKLLPISNSISFQVPNHQSVFLLSRRLFCSGDGAAGGSSTSSSSSSTSTSTTPISISFIDGYFKLYLDSIEFIFHYWSSIEMVRHSLQQHFEQQSNLNKISNLYFEHEVADIDGSTGTQREQQQYYRLSESMPFGYMFKVLDPSRIRLVQIGNESIENRKIYRKFSFGSTSLTDEEDKMRKLCLARIDDWSRENPIPPSGNSTKQSSYQSGSSFDSHELLFLEHERQSLLARFTPLERDFNKMVKTAKTEAHLRFKWGGLFLLSAQMGFVARLTWFEYSWDIMEPVTWFLTYVMMVGTFAYYLVTSQEYLVPMVEKRIILARFWKLVRSTNFDVLQYRTLRDELGQVEMKIQRIRDSLGVTNNGPSNSSSTYPYNTIQARPLGDKEHL